MLSKLVSEIYLTPWCITHDSAMDHFKLIPSILKGENVYARGEFPIKMVEGIDGFDLESETKQSKIAVISLTGIMLKHGGFCSYGTLEIAERINECANDDSISAILIQVDSPGGSATSIAPIMQAVIAAKEKKPVGVIADYMCSAAYYALVPANFIMAENNISSLFGSIGVYIVVVNDDAANEKEGLVIHEIYADQSANKNEEYRDAIKGNYKLMKETRLNPMAIQFREEVIKYRGSKIKQDGDEGVFKGRTYDAANSLKVGLIDYIGSFNQALTLLNDMVLARQFDKQFNY